MKNLVTCLSFLGLLLCVPSSLAQADETKEYEFKIETLKAQPTMTVRFKVSSEPKKISAKYAEVFGAVFTHVLSNGGQLAGAPFSRYHAVTEDELDIEAGLPVAKAIEGKGDIKVSELPGGKVVTTVHHGPYEKLGNAHNALQKWVSDKGYKATSGVWESYVTDPSKEKDQSKWQTKLFLVIAEKKADKPK